MLTPATFQQRQDERFADNEFQHITEGSFRALAADMLATFVPLAEANVPAYDPERFYAEQYLVTFEGLYYRAKIQGFLPAPTPGQETAEWKPDLKPLPPTLPYCEMSVQQGQDFGSDGLLVPSTLYRLLGRVDADGAALDDVLVVALSRHHVNEADAYTIGVDPQTRQEQLTPVSYDLVTDATAARSTGGGGAAPLAPATTAALGGLIVGAGLQVTPAGKVSLKIDSNTLGQQADGTLYVLSQSGDISLAATPQNVTAVFVGNHGGQYLSWDASPGAQQYRIRRQVNGGAYIVVGAVPYPYYLDDQDQEGQYVKYFVCAENGAGESPITTVVCKNP